MTPKLESEVFDEHLEAILNDKPIAHLSLAPIDSLIGGVYKGRVIVFCGGPGTGKTTFLEQMASDLAAKGIVVVTLTLELAPHQFVRKALMRLGAVINRAEVESTVPNQTTAAIDLYRNTIAPNACFVDDETTFAELREFIAAQRQRNRDVALCVDYLQLMKVDSDVAPCMDEQMAIKTAMARIRDVATRFGAPVFAVSTITRSSYKSANPLLDCLGGSSSIEYAADAVILMRANLDTLRHDGSYSVTFRALKNRYGALGTTTLTFHPSRCDFVAE